MAESIFQERLRRRARDDGARQRKTALQDNRGASPVRRLADDRTAPSAGKPNDAALPYQLKQGIESLSGIAMDNVKVHYNSSKPAQLNAHAYAQGTDIHLAPGQEKHLPHEAWHVVQQAQGRVKPTAQMRGAVGVNDDAGLEREADTMGGRASLTGSLSGMAPAALEGESKPAQTSVKSGRFAQPVQRVAREAQVAWGVTHMVQVQEGETLFGADDDPFKGERGAGELAELRRGQRIVVDDEETFMSRRGANQEISRRRQEDRDADELKHRWVKVLAVVVQRGAKPVPADVYVRAETIALVARHGEGGRKAFGVATYQGAEQEHQVTKGVTGIHEAWEDAAKKRRRSVDRVTDIPEDSDESGVTSGWNWDTIDEGVNVSGYMKEPHERGVGDNDPSRMTLGAQSAEDHEPSAYMVIEDREENDQKILYIRWLIGHPEKRGGGQTLMQEAIRKFEADKSYVAIRVDSAYASVSWYEKMGFRKVDPHFDPVQKGKGYKDTELIYTRK